MVEEDGDKTLISNTFTHTSRSIDIGVDLQEGIGGEWYDLLSCQGECTFK